MKNIYEKIDTMFSGQNDDRPQWAVELLDELKEIKSLLKDTQKQPTPSSNINNNDYSYNTSQYQFVLNLREKYNDNHKYPEDIIYNNQRLGISEGGLLYNKVTNRVYSTTDAKIIYNELYLLSKNEINYASA